MATAAQLNGFGNVSDRPEPGVLARLWSDGNTVWRDSGSAWEVYCNSVPPPTQPYYADEIGYDNATTGLVATSVQGAIDELFAAIPTDTPSLYDSRVAKTAGFTVVDTDQGINFDCTSGTFSIALTAAASLGANFSFAVFNSGSGVITIDPNGAETIRDASGSAATKTLSQGEGAIVFCDGTGWKMMKVSSGGQTLATLGAIFNTVIAKTSGFTAVLADKGQIFNCTSGTFSIAFDPAATLLTGWTCAVFNSGSGVVTLDPNGSETIRDATSSATTKTLAQGEGGIIICNGTDFLFLKTVADTTGGGGGTKTLRQWSALDNQPPVSTYATFNTRNSIAVLEFDPGSDEGAVFVGIIPEAASFGTGIKVRLIWAGATAVSGDVVWESSFERGTTDLDTDSFGTAKTATAAANGTSGIVTSTDIDHSSAEIDSLVAGDLFRLKIRRVGSNGSDTMTGDAQLIAVEIQQR